MRQTGGFNRPWATYFVLSKKSWQGYAKIQKDPSYTLSIKHKWLAESEDKAMMESMMKLLEEK